MSESNYTLPKIKITLEVTYEIDGEVTKSDYEAIANFIIERIPNIGSEDVDNTENYFLMVNEIRTVKIEHEKE